MKNLYKLALVLFCTMLLFSCDPNKGSNVGNDEEIPVMPNAPNVVDPSDNDKAELTLDERTVLGDLLFSYDLVSKAESYSVKQYCKNITITKGGITLTDATFYNRENSKGESKTIYKGKVKGETFTLEEYLEKGVNSDPTSNNYTGNSYRKFNNTKWMKGQSGFEKLSGDPSKLTESDGEVYLFAKYRDMFDDAVSGGNYENSITEETYRLNVAELEGNIQITTGGEEMKTYTFESKTKNEIQNVWGTFFVNYKDRENTPQILTVDKLNCVFQIGDGSMPKAKTGADIKVRGAQVKLSDICDEIYE